MNKCQTGIGNNKNILSAIKNSFIYTVRLDVTAVRSVSLLVTYSVIVLWKNSVHRVAVIAFDIPSRSLLTRSQASAR